MTIERQDPDETPDDLLRVGTEGTGAPLPGVDDLGGCLAGLPGVDDAEGPVPPDASAGEGVDPVGVSFPGLADTVSCGFAMTWSGCERVHGAALVNRGVGWWRSALRTRIGDAAQRVRVAG